MFAKVRQLEEEVRRLREELAFTIAERDEALNKAVEMMHINTYISEKWNRKGLELIKKGDCE